VILGLCGLRGHGKDTFARILCEHDTTLQRLAFADELKRICRLVFGLTDYQVSVLEGKERLLSAPINIDAYLTQLETATGLKMSPTGLVANTSREVLQYVGTDYVRKANPTYWLDKVSGRIAATPKTDFVVTDVRFPNEAERIHQIGGLIVRVHRLEISDPFAVDEKVHASERIEFEPDVLLGVFENCLDIYHTLGSRLQAGGTRYFERGLHGIDYREIKFWGEKLSNYVAYADKH
jgi:hypothetical protein